MANEHLKKHWKAYLVAFFLLLFFLYLFSPRWIASKTSYILAAPSESNEIMLNNATQIVEGKVIGRREILRVDDTVSFSLTTLQVSQSHKGGKRETVTIVQTDGCEADIELKNGKTYVLLLEPYVMGSATEYLAPKLDGTYVCVDGYRGTFEKDANGKLTEFIMPWDSAGGGDTINTMSNGSHRASAVQNYINSK